MFCQVTMKVTSHGKPKEIWFVLESTHGSLAALYRDLADKGMLYGSRLETQPDGSGRRKVVDEYDTIVMRDSIVAISDMQNELVDTDGSVLWTFDRGEAAQAAAQ